MACGGWCVCGTITSMANKTSVKDPSIQKLLERRSNALEGIEKATKKLEAIESRIGRWLVQHLGEIYENWSPHVGDQAVRIVFRGEKPGVSMLRVLEIHGRTISVADNLDSRWRIRVDLEQIQRHMPGEDEEDRIIEIIVPPDAYDQEVRHWLGIRKSARTL